MNLTTYELDRIKDDHSKGRKLTRLAITKLIRELDIAKEDVRGIELKIDATYAMNGALKAEIAALNAKIEGYQMKYENTGSMFGRQAQAATIEENKRLRAALDFYADKKNHTSDGITPPEVYADYGEKARQILEETE